MPVFLISVLAAFIPIAVYILFLRWLDRYEREPLRHIIVTFLLGATISVGFSFLGNTVIGFMSQVIMTRAGSEFLIAGFIAPIIEETNKGFIVFLFAICSKEFDNLTDGLLYGAVVGLGFAFSENILYFVRIFHENGQFAWLKNMYVRSLFTAGLHASATSIFGACIALCRHSKWVEKLAFFLIGWIMAVMVHSFWNSFLTAASLSNDAVLSLLPFLCLPFVFLILFITFQVSLSRESKILEEELTAEAKDGVIPLDHVPYLKSYLARSKSGWFNYKVPKSLYINLTTKLAFLKNQYWEVPETKRSQLDKEIENIRTKIKEFLKYEGNE